jgi:lipoprotein-anchoring transpeptidase ErfK/SrfK
MVSEICKMRGKIMIAAVLAAVASFTLAPSEASARGELVAVSEGYPAGTIVVRQSERRLYLMVGNGEAIRYPVGVGRHGMQWSGTVAIDGKYVEPAWSAPASIRKDYSKLPAVIPGGSPQNPMGVAALTLSGGGQYAIHGTNQPSLIGGFISHGCIRMYNADITDLYGRVSVGTPVVVTR